MRVEDEGCWFRVYGLGLRVSGLGLWVDILYFPFLGLRRSLFTMFQTFGVLNGQPTLRVAPRHMRLIATLMFKLDLGRMKGR